MAVYYFLDCLEMLMETDIYKTPQEKQSLLTITASNNTTANDFDYRSSNLTPLDTNNEFPVEHSENG